MFGEIPESSLTDISPKDFFLDGQFPERTFPRTDISPNHVFHLRSKKVIDMS